jgi:hypothetical protein
MIKYRATFEVEVEFEVDPAAIDRVLNNEDDWAGSFYDLDEEGVVEMLAYNCGIMDRSISDLDGWSDLPDSALKVIDVNNALRDYVKVWAQ